MKKSVVTIVNARGFASVPVTTANVSDLEDMHFLPLDSRLRFDPTGKSGWHFRLGCFVSIHRVCAIDL
jgi:hypothetical protein